MSIRILLIEDNPDHILITKRILEKANEDYQLDSESQAQEGLRRIIEENYDLILCDYHMPGLNALDILKEMKNKDKDLPFIVVTATGNEKAAVDLMKEGAYDYMLKDVLYEETLPVVIKKAIERYNTKKEKERAEEALQESERRYRLLAENVTDVIWTTDMNLRLTYISSSVKHLLGYSVEEAVSLKWEKILTPASYVVAMKVFTEELVKESREQKDLFRSRTLELEQICKSGSTIWTETKLTLLGDPNGSPVGILGVTRDITERKKMEHELEKRMRDLEKFQKVAVGRELRMIELKKRLEKLEARTGVK